MPIEREPKSPLPNNFVPHDGIAYRVQDGDTWQSVARANNIKDVWGLIEYNFKTRSPAEVNYYLKSKVGCVDTTKDGKNWIFSSDASPGIIYLLPENTRKPAGSGNYIVREGDTFKGVAYKYGYYWETLWELQDNRELKKVRKEPKNVLPGDHIEIPNLTVKNIEAAVENTHRFKRKGKPQKLGSLTLYLELNAGRALNLSDTFILKGTGGEEPYDETKILKDNMTPFADGIVLIFMGMPMDAYYTLKVAQEDGQELTIFQDIAFDDLHQESDQLAEIAVQPE